MFRNTRILGGCLAGLFLDLILYVTWIYPQEPETWSLLLSGGCGLAVIVAWIGSFKKEGGSAFFNAAVAVAAVGIVIYWVVQAISTLI